MILTDEGERLKLKPFAYRAESLLSRLKKGSPLTVSTLVSRYPELGSLDSIQKQIALLERFGLVRVVRGEDQWKTKVEKLDLICPS